MGVFKVSLVAWVVALIFEQQRRELVQAAAPRLPLVRGVGRFVEDAVDASFFERCNIRLGVAAEAAAGATDTVGAEFTTAIADEHEFDLLLERGHLGDVRRSDYGIQIDRAARHRVASGGQTQLSAGRRNRLRMFVFMS